MKPAKEVVNELLFGGRTIFGTPEEVHERRAKRLERDRIVAKREALEALEKSIEVAIEAEREAGKPDHIVAGMWSVCIDAALTDLDYALRLLDEPAGGEGG